MNYNRIVLVPTEIAVRNCYVEPNEDPVFMLKLGIGLGRAETTSYLTQSGATKLRNLLNQALATAENSQAQAQAQTPETDPTGATPTPSPRRPEVA